MILIIVCLFTLPDWGKEGVPYFKEDDFGKSGWFYRFRLWLWFVRRNWIRPRRKKRKRGQLRKRYFFEQSWQQREDKRNAWGEWPDTGEFLTEGEEAEYEAERAALASLKEEIKMDLLLCRQLWKEHSQKMKEQEPDVKEEILTEVQQLHDWAEKRDLLFKEKDRAQMRRRGFILPDDELYIKQSIKWWNIPAWWALSRSIKKDQLEKDKAMTNNTEDQSSKKS